MKPPRSRPLAVLSLVVVLLGGACGGGTGHDHGATGGTSERDGGNQPMLPGHGDDHDHAHDESSPVAEGARRIQVRATEMRFDPDEITVRAGEDIAVVLTSVDMLHDFTIDEFGAHVAAERGDTNTGGFRADRPGRFSFYCEVPGHRAAGMEGTLVVEG